MSVEAEFSEALSTWERELRVQSSNVVRNLREGLTRGELDARLAEVGLSVPAELGLLWSWHDGVERSDGQDGWIGGNGMTLLSLEQAVAERARRLEMAAALEQDDDPRAREDGLWPRHWLPIGQFGNGDVAVVDCWVAAGEPTPVRQVGWDSEDFKEPKLPSLTALVQMFIELLRSRAWSWDASQQRWVTDFDRIPRQYQMTMLV